MKSLWIDFCTKTIISKQFIIAALLFLIIVFGAFRWINSRHSGQLNVSIEGILRDEYLNANSYLVAKKLSDLERLGLIQCVRLKELAPLGRDYYNTSHSKHCYQKGLLYSMMVKKTEFIALNGLHYQLSYQIPTQWENLLLEVFLILSGLFSIGLFTQRRLSEKQKAQERLNLLKIEKEMMNDVTSQIRHDIASPLMAIQTIAHVAEIDQQYKELLLKAVNRTEKIFSDLKSLKTSNLDSDVSVESIKPCDLSLIVTGIQKEKEMSWLNSEKTAPLVSFSSEFVPCLVKAQENELARIISNLFNNSMEAALPDQSLKIHWSITKKLKWICLSIKDNGKGVPQNVLEKLGTKGFSWGKNQVDRCDSSLRGAGAGLGLYHAKTSIERWGGKIEIQSTSGQGTTVVLFLLEF